MDQASLVIGQTIAMRSPGDSFDVSCSDGHDNRRFRTVI